MESIIADGRSLVCSRRCSDFGGRSQPNSQTIPAPVSIKTIDSQLYRKAHTNKVKDTIAAAEHVWKGYRAFVLKHRRNQ
jgi:hypothetical protein